MLDAFAGLKKALQQFAVPRVWCRAQNAYNPIDDALQERQAAVGPAGHINRIDVIHKAAHSLKINDFLSFFFKFQQGGRDHSSEYSMFSVRLIFRPM